MEREFLKVRQRQDEIFTAWQYRPGLEDAWMVIASDKSMSIVSTKEEAEAEKQRFDAVFPGATMHPIVNPHGIRRIVEEGDWVITTPWQSRIVPDTAFHKLYQIILPTTEVKLKPNPWLVDFSKYSDPGRRSGDPTIPGTRFTISQLLAEIANTNVAAEIADEYDLDEEEIRKILGDIAWQLHEKATKERPKCRSSYRFPSALPPQFSSKPQPDIPPNISSGRDSDSGN